MEFLTGCFGSVEKGGVPVLKKAVLRKGNRPVVFACVLGRGAAWSAEFWNRWFGEEALPCCTAQNAGKCVDKVKERFLRSWRNLWKSQTGPDEEQRTASAAVWFAAGGECFYAWQGEADIRLLNLCFDRVHMKSLTTHSGELICRRAALEPGIGILLGGASFFEHFSGELLRDCLEVRGIRREEQVRRRLAEAAAEAKRRGAGDGTAVLAVIRQECSEAFQTFLQANGYRDPVPVGRGAFGKVYRVREASGRRFLACKTAEGAEGRALLRREAGVQRRLAHPLFAAYIDCLEGEDVTLLLTEYVKGRDLDELLESGPLSPKRAAAIAVQLAEGLHYLHDREEPLLYRDLKPANIRIDRTGRVKILDLGCVCELRDAKAAKAGSRGYAAPEQLCGGTTGRYSDVYAWGRVFEEMVAGGELPPSLERLISACTQEDPARRPQNMDIVLESMKSIPGAGGCL